MNVSERQQKKKKKKGFWERTEAKGSVKGQSVDQEENDNTRVTRQARKQGRQSYCQKFVDV